MRWRSRRIKPSRTKPRMVREMTSRTLPICAAISCWVHWTPLGTYCSGLVKQEAGQAGAHRTQAQVMGQLGEMRQFFGKVAQHGKGCFRIVADDVLKFVKGNFEQINIPDSNCADGNECLPGECMGNIESISAFQVDQVLLSPAQVAAVGTHHACYHEEYSSLAVVIQIDHLAVCAVHGNGSLCHLAQDVLWQVRQQVDLFQVLQGVHAEGLQCQGLGVLNESYT